MQIPLDHLDYVDIKLLIDTSDYLINVLALDRTIVVAASLKGLNLGFAPRAAVFGIENIIRKRGLKPPFILVADGYLIVLVQH